MKKALIIIAITTAPSCFAASLNPIPRSNGMTGSIGVGMATKQIASNFYRDDENAIVDNQGKADVHFDIDPVVLIDARYTLAESRTQFVLGNQVHDALRFDYTQQLGIRHELVDTGIVSAGLVFSGIARSKVWADPYQIGSKRESTKRKSMGYRLGWENIFNSSFNVDINRRKIELDNEDSGVHEVQLTSQERGMLNRNGYTTVTVVTYNWKMTPKHLLSPGFSITNDDLDGKAMSNTASGITLDYLYHANLNTLTLNFYAGTHKYDKGNPLFDGDKPDSTDYLVAANYLRHQLFSQKPLSGWVSAAYGKTDTDINFFYTEARRISLGLQYIF